MRKIIIMENFFQAFIMAFREGLEGFLIISIMLKFLEKINKTDLKKHVWTGTGLGLLVSIVFGMLLFSLSSYFGGVSTTAKIWESLVGFLAVMFLASFIVWMIKHGAQIKKHIEDQTALNLSVGSIVLLVAVMISREGAEIAIFSFAGK